ncbi:hypothetical protein M0R45_024768 [Rubus argutus]|uniref:Uncharacterized protein n=1 Tax=Rubus argutus TaxID=59490 RepID=A0AAW1WU52_RUBAR
MGRNSLVGYEKGWSPYPGISDWPNGKNFTPGDALETAQGYDDRGSSWAPGEELLQGINKDAAELVVSIVVVVVIGAGELRLQVLGLLARGCCVSWARLKLRAVNFEGCVGDYAVQVRAESILSTRQVTVLSKHDCTRFLQQPTSRHVAQFSCTGVHSRIFQKLCFVQYFYIYFE